MFFNFFFLKRMLHIMPKVSDHFLKKCHKIESALYFEAIVVITILNKKNIKFLKVIQKS